MAIRIKRESNRIRIPFHIVMEILSRLPARSLVKFRQVCKLWRSITHDPDFIETHLERARKDRPPSILLVLPDYKWDRFGITILDNSLTPNQILSRPKPQRRFLSLSGPCNGLLCNSGDNGCIELMNPATGESLTLPEPTRSTQLLAMPFLGFHPATKEYKVVHFFPNPHISDENLLIGFEVYTLGASSWRHICDLDYLPCNHGPVVKGAMYWNMLQCRGNRKYLVISFDLKDERFTWISSPNFEIYQRKRYRIASNLVELQGSVCMSVFPDPDIVSVDIWMLNDENGTTKHEWTRDIWMLNDENGTTKHEWTRKHSIIFGSSGPQVNPLLIQNERILVYKTNVNRSESAAGLSLHYHHLKSGSEEQVYHDDDHLFEPFVHVESLVALGDQRLL